MTSKQLTAFIRRTFCVTDEELPVLRWMLRELDLVEFEERAKEVEIDVDEDLG